MKTSSQNLHKSKLSIKFQRFKGLTILSTRQYKTIEEGGCAALDL